MGEKSAGGGEHSIGLSRPLKTLRREGREELGGLQVLRILPDITEAGAAGGEGQEGQPRPPGPSGGALRASREMNLVVSLNLFRD